MSVVISHLNFVTPNILSTLYLLDIDVNVDLSKFRVVSLSINDACATLIFQRSLRSSGVTVECFHGIYIFVVVVELSQIFSLTLMF